MALLHSQSLPRSTDDDGCSHQIVDGFDVHRARGFVSKGASIRRNVAIMYWPTARLMETSSLAIMHLVHPIWSSLEDFAMHKPYCANHTLWQYPRFRHFGLSHPSKHFAFGFAANTLGP